ncbi:hypothetical protein ASF84_02400 [Pseudomonas sp. Leaf127]|nr:hypothetical protein ASF84_02400 [Pseudomonas sp. Leaf127]
MIKSILIELIISFSWGLIAFFLATSTLHITKKYFKLDPSQPIKFFIMTTLTVTLSFYLKVFSALIP